MTGTGHGAGPTRRTVLKIGVGAAVVASVPLGTARAAAATPRTAPAATFPSVPVEGTGLQVAVRGGDPATVLTHVARRYHYEVRPVTCVEGVRTEPGASPRVLAHADGTAVHLDPRCTPPGLEGTLAPHELAALREVLADAEGLVLWGGDDAEPCEGHLRLGVPADDPAVADLAARLAQRHGAPADGAAVGPQQAVRAESFRTDAARRV